MRSQQKRGRIGDPIDPFPSRPRRHCDCIVIRYLAHCSMRERMSAHSWIATGGKDLPSVAPVNGRGSEESECFSSGSCGAKHGRSTAVRSAGPAASYSVRRPADPVTPSEGDILFIEIGTGSGVQPGPRERERGTSWPAI